MTMIAKNLKHLRHLKKLTQEVLAEDLHVTRSRISSYEEGRSAPSLDFLIAVSDYFKLPIDILLRKNLTLGQSASFIEIGNQRVVFPIVVKNNNENGIEVVPITTTAGYLSGYADPEYMENLETINLPFLQTGKHRAFPIVGDSMLPMKSGSYVIGHFIENRLEIISGRTYVLITKNDGLVYKRVYNYIESRQCLVLVSDNKNYMPYEIPIEDILELWEFTCSILTQEYFPKELKTRSVS